MKTAEERLEAFLLECGRDPGLMNVVGLFAGANGSLGGLLAQLPAILPRLLPLLGDAERKVQLLDSVMDAYARSRGARLVEVNDA